jgi:hypothetical protein
MASRPIVTAASAAMRFIAILPGVCCASPRLVLKRNVVGEGQIAA